jgi:hypothetical protein
MAMGAKNKAAVLNASSKPSYVKGVFECGLLESKPHPWMVASPDGVAVVTLNSTDIIFTSVEIKNRVATERVTKAQQISIKYQHKLITCDIGDETWKDKRTFHAGTIQAVGDAVTNYVLHCSIARHY